MILGGMVGIFVEESIGGGGNGLSESEGLGDAFTKLSLASAKLSLESKDERILNG